jgi:hypothetical protein
MKSETEKDDHSTCADVLREVMASMGVDIVASTAPPIVSTPYVTDPFSCPHGVLFWIEPTSEQIAQWVRDAARKEGQ